MPLVTVPSLKDELGLTSNAHNVMLALRIQEAEAEYAEYVGPLPGTYTETLTLPTVLPRGTVEATATWDGSPVDVTLDRRSGLLTGYATTAEVTYTIGDLPANHAAAMRADIAEWWMRTQQGGGPSRPSFAGDASLEPDTPARPLVLFPRIRALATSSIA